MKFLQQIILLTFIIFCVNQSVTAQDNFSKYSEHLDALHLKTHESVNEHKLPKRKHVGEVLAISTSDYSLLLADNPSFPKDTIPRKRLGGRTHDSSDPIVSVQNYSSDNSTDSIPKKKKKKKEDDFLSMDESAKTDSILNGNLSSADTTILITDTIIKPLQMLYMDSAYQFLSQNKYEDAILYYDIVTSLFGGTDEFKYAFYWRAKAEMGKNDLASAFNDINSFISIDNCTSTFCTDAYYTRGLVSFKMKEYESAGSDFSKALTDSIFSNLKYCYFYRAFCLGESEKYIQAVQDYTKFLNLDKYKSVSSAEALYYRGFYKVKLDDNRGAISDYDLAIEMYSGAYESSKNKNQIYFQKLIDTYITRGLAYADIKKWDQSIADYNTVIKMKPDYATAYHLKGLSEIGKGDLDAGCLDLSKAGELGSVDAYSDIKLHCK